ncbi:MAG: PAS domain S-box protein, partial [Methylocystis sp.]
MLRQGSDAVNAKLLRAALDSVNEAVCILDDTSALVLMSEAAEDLTGYKETELLGAPVPLVPPIGADLDEPVPGKRACRLRRLDGSEIEIEVDVRALARSFAGYRLLIMRRASSPSERASSREEQESTLRQIFDTIPDGVILIDEAGIIKFFSTGAQRLFGYERRETVGQNVKMLMPWPTQGAHDEYIATYLRTGKRKIIGVGREVIARRRDGSLFPVYLSIGEFWLHGRRRFLGVTHDLTERKQAAQRYLTLSSAMDQSPVAVLIADREGVIQYVNESFSKLTGYIVHELVNETPRVLSSQHTAPEQYLRLWRTIGEGREWRGEIENRRKDGSLYWAMETIKPLRDASGEITHYIAIQEDITAQKRDREALIESEARFRHVAEMTGEWLWEQDAAGRYIYSSAGVKIILGYAAEEIIGRSYHELHVDAESDDSSSAEKPR